jgi:hypothetical protein
VGEQPLDDADCRRRPRAHRAERVAEPVRHAVL